LGDTLNFNIARKWGVKVLDSQSASKFISREKVHRMRALIHSKGEGFIFFVRFLPLIRTPIFFAAGLMGVRPRKFYLLNGISTLLYLALLIPLAIRAANHIDELIVGIKKFQFTLLGIVLITLLLLSIKKSRARSKTRSG
jgi:membrane-associated protein